MSTHQLTLKFYSQQDHVSSVVEEFHKKVNQFAHEEKSNSPTRLQAARHQIDLFYQRLSKEVENFVQMAQHISLANNARPYTEKLKEETQQIQNILREYYAEWSREDWHQFLSKISSKLIELKQSISEHDFRQTLDHVAEVVLLDHFDNLGQKQKIQWLRKAWHMLGSLILVTGYLWLPLSFNVKIWIFAISLITIFSLDVYRLNSSHANAKVFRALRFIMRKQEATRLSSSTFYMISCFFVVAIFSKPIAILSILYLGFGDSIASIVGVKWGKRRLDKRFSFAGSLAFFTICFLLTLSYPYLDPNFSGSIWILALLGGICGMLSERCAGPLDDNLAIPICSAIFLYFILFLF
ncbi:MAG: hypothetical protein H7A32_02995 [Deltaproteobacteria bacterium]|nr:hypothetical protein [Deltaproteobacteria bacterium]